MKLKALLVENEDTGKRKMIIRIALIATLLGIVACAPAVVTPLPQNVRRIAVLPPYQVGTVDARTGADSGQIGRAHV